MDSTTDRPRSNERPSILLEFETRDDQQAFITAMVHAIGRQTPPPGMPNSDKAFERILTWGVR